jgi:hypothetical protein
MASKKLTASRLREVLIYSPVTGRLWWKLRTSNRVKLGALAGAPHKGGYIQIMIDGENWLAHRLAWLHFYGEFPEFTVDHKNGSRIDNRISNLRDVELGINVQNIRRPHTTNRSGFLGVSWSKHQRKWVAQISIENRTVPLGAFENREAAHAAYLTAKRANHAGCTI